MEGKFPYGPGIGAVEKKPCEATYETLFGYLLIGNNKFDSCTNKEEIKALIHKWVSENVDSVLEETEKKFLRDMSHVVKTMTKEEKKEAKKLLDNIRILRNDFSVINALNRILKRHKDDELLKPLTKTERKKLQMLYYIRLMRNFLYYIPV